MAGKPQRGSARGRVKIALDEGFDPKRPARELAVLIGCSLSTVEEARRSWRHETHADRERRKNWERGLPNRCRRCTTLGWERNPLDADSGLCLWCQLELAGVDVAEVLRMD